MIGLAWFYGV